MSPPPGPTPFAHHPVMVAEVVELFAPVPPGVVVDLTLGGGGHAAALLEAHDHLSLVGIDRDADALVAATATLQRFGPRVVAIHHARFDSLDRLVAGPVSGVLADLGVSSYQLDRAERGFSYHHDGPLDMRMDRRQGPTAADVVNGFDERALAHLIAEAGEARFARRIARRIVVSRPLSSTTELAELVRDAIPAPARRTGGHPARAVFQAVRLAVNDELGVLAPTVGAGIGLLAPGGRLVVLAYHSGEDRIVKNRFLEAASGGCRCPAALPCGCGAVPLVRLLNRGARKPSAEESAAHPRSSSGRLRACERLAYPAGGERR
ncbi:MAG: 16S rRNA (cytosine(1402)-N(4))-methyltransferase RsmH [Acidimicrobiales bacterium]